MDNSMKTRKIEIAKPSGVYVTPEGEYRVPCYNNGHR